MLSAVCARLARSAADAVAFDDILGRIDWDRVGSAIRSVQLPEPDYATLSSMILKACRRWVVDDVVPSKRIIGVEKRFLVVVPENETLPVTRIENATKADEQALPAGTRVLKGFADLVIEVTNPWTKRTELTIVDWKTTGSLDDRWVNRHLTSWQGWLSCWALRADRFIYRGIQRDGRCKDVTVDWPVEKDDGYVVWGDEDAYRYVWQVFGKRDTLRNSSKWPTNTDSCGQYGRQCEHYHVCQVLKEPPEGAVTNAPFSYSTIKEFENCNERYRLGRIRALPDDDGGGAFGTAFHRGIADVYEQLRGEA